MIVTPPLNPSPMKFSEIEDYAQAIAAELAFNRESESVRDFARKLGGHIVVLDRPASDQLQGGSLEVRGPQDFTIFLSPITSTLRDNFTIGHELGHYFLHTNQGHLASADQPIRVPRSGTGQLEQQANRFAAALLMPKDEFLKVADSTKANLDVLAGCFQVSTQAAQIRLESLKNSA